MGRGLIWEVRKIAPKNEENKSLYQKQIKLNELKPIQIDNHSTRCFSAVNPEYSGSKQQSIKRINALGKHHAMNPEEKVRKISDSKNQNKKPLMCLNKIHRQEASLGTDTLDPV